MSCNEKMSNKASFYFVKPRGEICKDVAWEIDVELEDMIEPRGKRLPLKITEPFI